MLSFDIGIKLCSFNCCSITSSTMYLHWFPVVAVKLCRNDECRLGRRCLESASSTVSIEGKSTHFLVLNTISSTVQFKVPAALYDAESQPIVYL